MLVDSVLSIITTFFGNSSLVFDSDEMNDLLTKAIETVEKTTNNAVGKKLKLEERAREKKKNSNNNANGRKCMCNPVIVEKLPTRSTNYLSQRFLFTHASNVQ